VSKDVRGVSGELMIYFRNAREHDMGGAGSRSPIRKAKTRSMVSESTIRRERIRLIIVGNRDGLRCKRLVVIEEGAGEPKFRMQAIAM
jgi:hypothetical protein